MNQEWILVTDRMPEVKNEESDEVIVTGKMDWGKPYEPYMDVDIAWYDGTDWAFPTWRGGPMMKVVAWMPMPKPLPLEIG